MVLPLDIYRNTARGVAFRPNTVVVLACLVPVISAFGVAVRKAIRAAKA